jgi:hypothetical protein
VEKVCFLQVSLSKSFKGALILSILNELLVKSGNISVNGSIAYVSQEPCN